MPLLTEFENPVLVADSVIGHCQTLPTPVEPIDADDLIDRMSRLIKRETNLGVLEMQVRFEGGRVILEGYCRTFYTKQMAQQAVLTALGKVELVNNIRVG